jgi:pyruvate formate lyase activating enzyme
MDERKFIVPVNYWHKLEDGRIQCDVCPRGCRLRDGQHGFCFVRAREGESMVLITYGRSSGFCIDPIEKKPLNQFLPGTPTLSFGTAGCNLACKFCQNWDLSTSRQSHTFTDEASPETIAHAASEFGCRSVAFTYNDPVIFLEYAVAVAKACHAHNIKTVAVTAAEICREPLAEFCQHLDAIKVDLKAFTEKFYHDLCGLPLSPVLEALEYIRHESKAWLELVTLLIPGENDSVQELEEMTQWVVGHLGPDVPMHFTAFHPDWQMQDHAATPPQTLKRARDIAMKNGVRYAYTGNVHDEAGGSTYCHQCANKVIGRDWYVITAWDLSDDGKCRRCGTPCAGVFDGPAGNWGNKRQPVKLK